MLQMGGKIPPEHSLLYNFFVWRDMTEIVYDFVHK